VKADRELRKTAEHEAAHALVGWQGGRRIESITIDPQRVGIDARGVCFLSAGRVDLIGAPESLTADQAHYLMAGRVSDDLFFPGGRPGHGQDFKRLEALLSLDDETLRMHAFPREEGMEAFYERFRGPVVKLLRSRRGRRAHKALAATLMEHRTLSGRHAAEVLREAWGTPLPPRALPLDDHCSITDKRPSSHAELFRHVRGLVALALSDCEAMRGYGKPKEILRRQRVENLLRLLLAAVDPPQGAAGRVLPGG